MLFSNGCNYSLNALSFCVEWIVWINIWFQQHYVWFISQSFAVTGWGCYLSCYGYRARLLSKLPWLLGEVIVSVGCYGWGYCFSNVAISVAMATRWGYCFSWLLWLLDEVTGSVGYFGYWIRLLSQPHTLPDTHIPSRTCLPPHEQNDWQVGVNHYFAPNSFAGSNYTWTMTGVETYCPVLFWSRSIFLFRYWCVDTISHSLCPLFTASSLNWNLVFNVINLDVNKSDLENECYVSLSHCSRRNSDCFAGNISILRTVSVRFVNIDMKYEEHAILPDRLRN